MAGLSFPAIPEMSRKRERRNPASFSRDSRSSYIAAGTAGSGNRAGVVGEMPFPGANPKPGAKAMNAAHIFALVPYLLAAPPATVAALVLHALTFGARP